MIIHHDSSPPANSNDSQQALRDLHSLSPELIIILHYARYTCTRQASF